MRQSGISVTPQARNLTPPGPRRTKGRREQPRPGCCATLALHGRYGIAPFFCKSLTSHTRHTRLSPLSVRRKENGFFEWLNPHKKFFEQARDVAVEKSHMAGMAKGHTPS